MTLYNINEFNYHDNGGKMKRKIFLFLVSLLLAISCSNIDLNNNIEYPHANNVSLSFIQITQLPKLKYYVGDNFDSSGLSVKAYYTDRSSKDVTDKVTFTGFDSSKPTIDQKITVNYSESNITKSEFFYINIEKTYTIIFKSNNTNQQEKRQTITLSENELFDSNNFILENYYFYKWNTEPDGSGISYKNLALTNELEFKEGQDSIELYAQWSSIIPITISKENYQTVLQDLENTIGKQYLFYCIDELSADMFEVIKNAIYNLFEVNIYLDFSSVTCRTSIEFRDRDYSNLISVQLPKVLGEHNYGFCFRNTPNLKYVKMDKKISYICDYAFYNCKSLESIIIPDNVYEISSNAFLNCTSLVEITLPNSVKKLGNSVFSNCSLLKKAQLGNSISYIGDSLFSNCSNLETINIPEKVTGIGYKAFYCCSKLKEIILPDSVTIIGDCAFENCSNLETFIMGKNVNTLANTAFNNCSSLRNIKLSESLSIIPSRIFYGCTSIINIVIPDRVTTIEGLSHCTNLQSVTIGKGIKNINYCAFSGCTKLTEVTFMAHYDWKLTEEIFDIYTGTITSTNENRVLASDFNNKSLIATYLRDTYKNYSWERITE